MTAGTVSHPTGVIVGLDLLTAGQRQADALIATLVDRLAGRALATMATHWAQLGERRHVSLSVELPDAAADDWQLLLAALPEVPARGMWAADLREGPPELQELAAAAARAHATRTSGRAVQFPGVDDLVGAMTAQHILDRSAIDRVHVLTRGDAPPDATVVTRDFVRPTWRAGELVLVVQPAVGDTLRPFEVPDPTPCCAPHV